MKKNKTLFTFVLIFFLIVLGLIVASPWKIIKINHKIFISELPRTEEEYQKGLGERDSLCPSCSMLFIFPKSGEYAFWMKDMHFNLDIIWIADDRIVYIKKDFSASSKETINPGIFADKVLEIRAGLSDKYDFKLGDKVSIY